MYNNAAGLASLVNSPYRDMDVMQVQMTPREVAGLQQLALSYGANEGDLYDPVTGQPRFNFLKKLLPMVIGAVLPGVPVLGKFASTLGGFFGASGAAASTLGTGLLVGGATALIEGDLKKGLMAGLGAYSGANLSQALQQASVPPVEKVSAEELAKTNQAIEAAKETVGARPVYNPTGTETDGLDYFKSANVFKGTPTAGDLAIGRQAIASGATTPDQILDYVKSANVLRGAPTAADIAAGRAANVAGTGIRGVFEGAQNLFTSPASRQAFGQALGGGFTSPMAQSLSRYATFAGAADAFTPEYEMPQNVAGEDYFYMPGGFNPLYGTGREQGYFLPGQYFKRSKQGLVPFNPFQMAPGVRRAATGGLMQAPDQNMNQPRAIPHPYQPLPNPNQNYPLSTVVQANYQANSPQPREVVSGYEPKIDPFTGEERFAEGGTVDDDRVTKPVTPDNVVVTPYSPPPATAADARQRYEQMLYAPPPPPRDVKPVMDYLANLNRRVANPQIYPYPGGTTTPPPPTGYLPPPPGTVAGGPPDDRGDGGGLGAVAIGGGLGSLGGARGGAGLPLGYQTGIGAGGSNFYQTFQPNIQEKFPVNIDPTKAVDKALGNTVVDKAKNKFVEWYNKRITDPMGLIGTAIGFTGAGMLGTYVWDKLSPKIKEYFAGLDKVLTPEEAAEAEAEAAKVASTAPKQNVSSGGGGGGIGPSLGGPTGYFDNSLQNFLNQYVFDQGEGKKGYVTVQELGMAQGGMTASNPFGAAVGEDYNFGFAEGGSTEYVAAGKLLSGPGDGMSDDIPAVIRGKGVQRAALADGEFVVPADVVSHLGNGSTNAGAKKLYAMMDRIRQDRTGKKTQARAVKPEKYLPA